MSFIVHSLASEPFAELWSLSPAALAARGIEVHTAARSRGYPCRVSLRDAEIGQRLLLLNYTHHDVQGPYRASHAIFVGEGARAAAPAPGEVPAMIARRQLSVRAFDRAGAMVDAAVVDGGGAAEVFASLLDVEDVGCLHVHTAARGCYLARVEGVRSA